MSLLYQVSSIDFSFYSNIRYYIGNIWRDTKEETICPRIDTILIPLFKGTHQLAHKSVLARDPFLLGKQWPARGNLWQGRTRIERQPCRGCCAEWESKGRQPSLTTGRTSRQASLQIKIKTRFGSLFINYDDLPVNGLSWNAINSFTSFQLINLNRYDSIFFLIL